jgi:hypothetical protein
MLLWNNGEWGQQNDNVVTLTAPSGATSAIGTLVTFPEQGWGGDTWGFENWGENATTVFVDVSSSGVATTNVGSISPTGMVLGLTGQSSTSSVGAPGLLFGPGSLSLSGVSATTSVGSLLTGVIVPLTAPSNLASSVGSIAPADVVGISGLSTTSSVGSMSVDDSQLVTLTAPSSTTSSVGSIIVETGVPLTAPSNLTGSVGAIAPADVVGLEGQQATTELSAVGLGSIGYKDIDITGNTSYTDVNHAA